MTSPSRGRGRLGVLVPFTNINLEPDLGLLVPAGVSIHVARIGGYDADVVPDAAQMAGLGMAGLDEPLRLLAGARPDVILYGCTSATLAHGPAFDRALVERVGLATGALTITAAGALVTALTALGVRRIGFASPYVADLNDRAIGFLAENGFETVARADIGRALGNDEQGALTPEQVFDLGRRADTPVAEAVVLSCTDMRSVETLERLEAALGKPVIASNQAMVFAALPKLGLRHDTVRCGRLFR